jgi:hypothetical protein
VTPNLTGPDEADREALRTARALPHDYVIVAGSGRQRKWYAACRTLDAAQHWAAQFWSYNPVIYYRDGYRWVKQERSYR